MMTHLLVAVLTRSTSVSPLGVVRKVEGSICTLRPPSGWLVLGWLVSECLDGFAVVQLPVTTQREPCKLQKARCCHGWPPACGQAGSPNTLFSPTSYSPLPTLPHPTTVPAQNTHLYDSCSSTATARYSVVELRASTLPRTLKGKSGSSMACRQLWQLGGSRCPRA